MNDKYDPDFDSPEARANFATRHIVNVAERRDRRNQLLKQLKSEPIVEMFPGRESRPDPEAIKTELAWIMSQCLIDSERVKICQCGTEKVIKRSSDPQRMRASLLSLVFFDQFVYTHYPQVYEAFRSEFSIPKLRGHSFGGNASPSWFIYSGHGYDKEADWVLISKTFVACVYHLRHWLREELGRPVPELKLLIEQESAAEFEENHRSKFQAPIGA